MLKTPFFRLVSVTAMVMMVGYIALLFLRYVGRAQQWPLTPHPWMQTETWLVARLSPADCSQAALEEILNLGAQWTIWLDLQLKENSEAEWVCPEKQIFELKSPTKPGPPLKLNLPALKNRHVIFNLRAMDVSMSTPFLKGIEAWAENKIDIGIASSSQSLLRDLRKKRPDWLFAADAATWTKLNFFAALGVESAVDLWPDFFVASQTLTDPNSFQDGSAAEIAKKSFIA